MEKPKRGANDNKDSKYLKKAGIKYLALSLPFLLISPILITIGIRILKKSDHYLLLVSGIILSIFTISLVVQGFRKLFKVPFKNEQ